MMLCLLETVFSSQTNFQAFEFISMDSSSQFVKISMFLEDAIIFIYTLFNTVSRTICLCQDSYVTGQGNGLTHGNFLHAKSI